MKQRNKRPVKNKERVSIIAASVFVLSALTLTGVYFSSTDDIKQEENLIDFTQLEKQNNVKEEAAKEITENKKRYISQSKQSEEDEYAQNNDMDVDPEYTIANSGNVETGKARYLREEVSPVKEEIIDVQETPKESEPQITFDAKAGLQWPIVGKVLLGYSMDRAIYHPTMKQYRYNPSIVIAANKGDTITAAADGKVKKIYKDAKTGNTIVFDIGDGYELTYGQLEDIKVKKGQHIKAGEVVGKVADPTIYYSEEGTNVYFMLTKDQTPVNPLDILK